MKSKHLKHFRVIFFESNLFSDPHLMTQLKEDEKEHSGTGVSDDHWRPYLKQLTEGILDGSNLLDIYGRALGYLEWYKEARASNTWDTQGEFEDKYWDTFWNFCKKILKKAPR